jgi:hypothetical protein
VLAAGRRAGAVAEKVLGARAPNVIPTTITIKPDRTGSRSALQLQTADRPGLLVDIVRVLKDCSLNVVSASVGTTVRRRGRAGRGGRHVLADPGRAQGMMADDTFYVTHKGSALSKSMETLVTNALQYYLIMAEIVRARARLCARRGYSRLSRTGEGRILLRGED